MLWVVLFTRLLFCTLHVYTKNRAYMSRRIPQCVKRRKEFRSRLVLPQQTNANHKIRPPPRAIRSRTFFILLSFCPFPSILHSSTSLFSFFLTPLSHSYSQTHHTYTLAHVIRLHCRSCVVSPLSPLSPLSHLRLFPPSTSSSSSSSLR